MAFQAGSLMSAAGSGERHEHALTRPAHYGVGGATEKAKRNGTWNRAEHRVQRKYRKGVIKRHHRAARREDKAIVAEEHDAVTTETERADP